MKQYFKTLLKFYAIAIVLTLPDLERFYVLTGFWVVALVGAFYTRYMIGVLVNKALYGIEEVEKSVTSTVIQGVHQVNLLTFTVMYTLALWDSGLVGTIGEGAFLMFIIYVSCRIFVSIIGGGMEALATTLKLLRKD